MKKIFTHFVVILDFVHLNNTPDKKNRKFNKNLRLLDQLNLVPSEEVINSILNYSKSVY